MLLARFEIKESRFGLVEKDNIRAIEGSIFDPEFVLTDQTYGLAGTRLLLPCRPTKIIAVGLNYRDHAGELEMDLPEEPLLFMKPSTSNTKNLIFGPKRLVSFVSKICTLLPGDIIATGTPGGVGPMKPGDEVEIRIQRIGSLKNRATRPAL